MLNLKNFIAASKMRLKFFEKLSNRKRYLMDSKSEIFVSGKVINFFGKEIRCAEVCGEITVVVFQADYPPRQIGYNNALAIRNFDGTVLWEVECDPNLDLGNPYEGVVDNGPFLIFVKAKSQSVAVNRHNGKILRNIDLVTGRRPW